ncbi:hypothetical protein, conserved [Babesia bigemina]|uniref:Zinc finger double-stranded RNA binding domain-containing protein n=1 Tax=Babesia bigemina TaxID=5866 RepID=A0A061D288_BABBI|nr:hypothetical protein, conserved [Babesia bigemina]CDR94866.1 hypothetical protein, conserved [Babesia bigemina]|eukprot:XP_012767052.1 hypothetical protein, conserved [Babesia bigemina]
MFKRAYVYACTAPLPEADTAEETDYAVLTEIAAHLQSERTQKPSKRRNVETVESDETAEQSQKDDDLIVYMTGGKVAKCKVCKGKTMLNEDAVKKHLDSKAHKKNRKKGEKEALEAEEVRRRFMMRMESLERRTKQNDRKRDKRADADEAQNK